MTQQLLHPNQEKKNYRSPIAEARGVGLNPSLRATDVGNHYVGRTFASRRAARPVLVGEGLHTEHATACDSKRGSS
jgi:hypothetical protein